MRNFLKSFQDTFVNNNQYIFTFLLLLSSYIFSINILAFYFYDYSINESDEKLLYVIGFSTIVFFSLFFIFVYEFIRQKFFLKFDYFYPIISFINLFFLNVLLISIRLFSIESDHFKFFESFIRAIDNQSPSLWAYSDSVGNIATYNLNLNFKLFLLIIILIIFSNIIFLFLLNFCKKINFENKKKFLSLILNYYPILILTIFLNFSNFRFFGVFGDVDTYYIYAYWLIPITFFLSFISLWHQRFFKFIYELKLNNYIYLILFIFLTIFIYDPNLLTEPFHQYHYLGPIMDIKAGKSLLVDIDSTYGVFIFYILSFFFNFLPISLKGLTFLNILLYFAQYLITFFLFKFITKSNYLSLIFISLIIILNFFSFYGPPITYPGSGPIRFLPALLIIFFEFKSIKNHNYFNFFQFLIIMIIGISAISGIDYFIFCFSTFIGMKIYNLFLNFGKKNQIKIFIFYLFMCLFFSLLAHIFFNFYIFLKSGEWPNYNLYFQHIFWYSDSWFMLPILPFGSWIYFILIPLLFIFIIFFKLIFNSFNQLNDEFHIISGFVVLALCQFLYFIGRSHLENLYHINLPITFLFLVFFYFLTINDKLFNKKNYNIFIFFLYFILIFAVLKNSPNVYKSFFHDPKLSRIYNYQNTLTNLNEVFYPKASSGKIIDGILLVNKYSKNKKRIPVFLQSYENSEILMMTNKTNVLSYNFFPQSLRILYFNSRHSNTDGYIRSNKLDKISEYWEKQINKINLDDILYVNFKCDFYYSYNETRPNINLGYTSFNYNVPCPGESKMMSGRLKVMYDYFFKLIKSKYNLKILETTRDGISAIKLEKK